MRMPVVSTLRFVSFCENTPTLLLFLYVEFSTHRLKSNVYLVRGNWQKLPRFQRKKLVQILKKYLRPISLTACVSKVAEEFVVRDYIMPAVLNNLDMNQYGAVPKSSTTFALIGRFHDWSKGTDGSDATIRTILFDYRKAFDLTDHSILITKLCKLNVPNSIINWIIDFYQTDLKESNLVRDVYLSGDQFRRASPREPN